MTASGTDDRVRVVVVDDSAVVRHVLGALIDEDGSLDLVGTANNGSLALRIIRQARPDVVVLDVEMPILDGLSTLGPLRAEFPDLPVVMFSTLTTQGGTATIEALVRGATDCVAKPHAGHDRAAVLDGLRAELLPKLRGLGAAHRRQRSPAPAAPPPTRARPAVGPRGAERVDAVVIGVSTGGPRALDEILPALPVLPVPVFLVQHMPPLFTALLAERLDTRGAMHVVEARDDEVVAPGTVYVAPGGSHLVVRNDGGRVTTHLTSDPPENSCRPAADPLFRSAVQAFGAHVLAVVLTGMGADGRAGSEAVVAAGGEVIVQDEESRVVWGMPGAVAAAGLASAVLPLAEIPAAIVRRVARTREMITNARPR